MKRKLLLSSTVIPALLASGAMGQVVNFHDDSNAQITFPGYYYNELFAGQGAYADPGNNIWNGFGYEPGYQQAYAYSGAKGSTGLWPQPYSNPGNPYAAYNPGTGWVSSTGPSLFDFATGSLTSSGNATSSGQSTPITLSVKPYAVDNGINSFGGFYVPPGSPSFLLGEAAISGSGEVFTLKNVPAGAYGLYLYGADFSNARGTLFSVNSGNAHNGIAATLNSGIGSPAQSFVEGQDFVIFENVTPDGSGNITITATPNPQDGVGNANLPGRTDVNGFQLIFHPPPTAVGATAAQNVFAGGTANFSFSPAFAASPSFRWQSIIGGVTNDLSDGGSIAGSGTTKLTVASVTSANVGLYQCRITTATATNTSPAAPLTILTSTATSLLQVGAPTNMVGSILRPGDILTDFGNTVIPPYSATEAGNLIPPPFDVTVTNVEDNTLYQYLNSGANGSVAPFAGPVGFVVTPDPSLGFTVVTGLRFFTASSHPEDDPADYLLEGSKDAGATFATIAGGLLGLPAQRNAFGGPINITNQVLKEIDFANSVAYGAYRLTFTNVNNNATASNGVQIAEVQLLGSLPAGPPGIAQQPQPKEVLLVGATFQPSVTPSGPGPLSYQWYFNSTHAIPNATNATLTMANVQTTNSATYTCTITSPYGTTNTSPLSLTVVAPTVYEAAVLADAPVAFYPLNETSGGTAFDLVGGYDGGYSNSPSLDVAGPSSFLPIGAGFDGGSQYVLLPETPALDFGGPVALEAWIQAGATQSGNTANIFGKGYDTSQSSDEFFLRVNSQTAFAGGFDNGGVNNVITAGTVTPDWTHLVLTYDGTNWYLYQNAQVVGTLTDNAGPVAYADQWAIADGTVNGNARYFAGNICAAAIYHHALTPAQVRAHYDLGTVGTTNLPPIVTVPTAPLPVNLGGDGSISATVTGPPPITYQWYKVVGGVTNPVPGGTNSTLSLTDIQGVPDIATNLGSAGANSDGFYNGNQATMKGRPGVLPNDTACHFDGSSQYVLVPTMSTVASLPPPFTVEGWVNPDTVPASGGFSCPFGSIYRATPAEGWIFYEASTGWDLRFGDTTGYQIDITDGVTPSSNTWYHLMTTFDGTNAVLYVNGTNVASGTTSSYTPNTTVPMGIGARGDAAFDFPGYVDEVAIYPSVLPTNAAAAHYAAVTTNAAGYAAQILASHPAGYWRLDEGLPPEYFLVVSNAYGAATSSVVALNIVGGPPLIVDQVFPPLTEAPTGGSVTLSVTASGTEPLSYQWMRENSAITGATDANYTFNALAGSNSYSVTITNLAGSISSSTAAVIGLTNPPPAVGLNGNGTGWSLNEGNVTTPTIIDNVLTLTQDRNSESCSAFYNTAQYISGFIASFVYTAGGNKSADGATFCLQNSPVGAGAVGGAGGGLGYTGITPSAALEMNLWPSDHGGAGIILGTNGIVPDTTGDVLGNFISTAPVSLPSGDPIYVELYYSQDVLNVWMMDVTTGAKFTTSFEIDLPGILGSSDAYVGFTAADGGAYSIQTITDFSFLSTTSVSVGPTLSIAKGTGGAVLITWPLTTASTFVLQQSSSVIGPWANITTTPSQVNGNYQISVTAGGSDQFFRLMSP